MTVIVNGIHVPNQPWEDRPEGLNEVVWRYSSNPIIGRDAIKVSNSIFNSAVVYHNGQYYGVFRCDDRARLQDLYKGTSEDGINWIISEEPIQFTGADAAISKKEYRYDPRLVEIEGKFYITWCNGYHGPTIGVAYTEDFETFHQLENAFLPFNRNGVLFPRKINGEYLMLSRPSDNGHTAFGDIFISHSPDMVYWGKHRHVLSATSGWQQTKIGAGPIPIETDEGWLMIYHGVLTSCNGYVYSFGAALLDRDEPWKVLSYSKDYLLSPQANYECIGDVPNVVFPCAALADQESGRITIYYGCADTVTGIAFTTVDEIVRWLKKQ